MHPGSEEDKLQRRAQGQGRGEKSRAEEDGVGEAGAEATKPWAHATAMTYCDPEQVTSAPQVGFLI